MSDPYKILEAAAGRHLSVSMDDYKDFAIGDAPIEKLFYVAVLMFSHVGHPEYGATFVNAKNKDAIIERTPLALFIDPQVQLDDWRVDFLISARNYGNRRSALPWRKLIVECDGHDFHERTKEQAARDRSRDRWAVEKGYDVFRFTGSELWSNAWGCAEQVFDWASWGL